MENRHDDISASDLLAKLKANIAETESAAGEGEAIGDGKKKYYFRRSDKTSPVVTEERIHREMPEEDAKPLFESPVPRSDIEDLDIDALMKKYLPEEDYARMTSGETPEEEQENDELVRTLTSIEAVRDDAEDGADGTLLADEETAGLAAPDSELFARLSAGGKVCDVPGQDEENEPDEKADTKSAPLRPMSEAERTRAYSLLAGSGREGEAAFGSIRDLLTAEPAAPKKVADDTPTGEVLVYSEETPAETAEVPAVPAEEPEEPAAAETAEMPASAAETIVIPASSAETVAIPIQDGETDETPVRPADQGETIPFVPLNGDTAIFIPPVAEEEKKLPEEAFSEDGAAEEAAPDDEEAPAAPVRELEEPESEAAAKEDFADGEEAGDEGSEDAAAVGEIPEDGDTADEKPFDETDANLMLAFGMDEELDQAIGKESADKLRTDMDELLPDGEKPVKTAAEKEPLREFISPAETKGIIDSYKVAYGKNALRLFGMIAVAIVLFFYENLTALGGHLTDALNPEFFPVVNVMVGLQILFIGFVLCFGGMVRGFRGLLEKKPTPESFLPVLFGVSVLYAICVCFFKPGTVFVTFYFPISLCLLFSVLNDRLNIRREVMAFNIVSSKRTKFALEKLDIDDAELETRAFDEFLPKQPAIFKINKTAFVDGYFRRTNAYPALKHALGAVLPATLIAFVVGFLVGVFKFRDWQSAVMLAYTVFAFCMPAAVFLTFGLPAFKAAKLSYAENSAFVGEAALDEYTSAASISFDDREVFPTGGVKLKSIKVFGSGRIDTVIYDAASVYSLLGGPLSDVLNVATADLGQSEDTEILSIENEGVEAVVDNCHLYLGKADYLRRHGYVPVSDGEDEELEGGGEISILFLVSDDEVVAKLYVRYRIDPEFEVTLKNLYRSGICVGIKTVDPNINDEMLSTRIRLSKYPVRVLKYTDITDSRRGSDRTDSGIVSKKSVKALLRTFTLCDKIKHVTRSNLVINLISMGAGLIIALSVALLGSITGISSVFVALFQLFWLIPIYLLSRFMLM